MTGEPISAGVQSRTKDLWTTEDARRMARRRLPRMLFDFIDGAAGSEFGALSCRRAFDDVRLMPRVLVQIEDRSQETSLFGRTYGLPFGIAPMGMCNLSHPEADRLFAAEAVARRFPHALSTSASSSIEEHARAAGDLAWFQLYVDGAHEDAMALVDRAAAAGYEVLLFTVDVPTLGRRVREHRRGFKVPLDWTIEQIADFALHPRWSIATLLAGVPEAKNSKMGAGSNRYDRSSGRGTVDWVFLDRLRERWKGKLVVKGVLAPEDAVRSRDAGCDGVYVSSHGARQLDSAPAPLAMLPDVRAAVGEDYPLLLDGGVRSGEDVIKALALGADFVMMGRPFLFAVAADGERGLATQLDNLVAEMDIAMAQIGTRTITEIDRSVLARDT